MYAGRPGNPKVFKDPECRMALIIMVLSYLLSFQISARYPLQPWLAYIPVIAGTAILAITFERARRAGRL